MNNYASPTQRINRVKGEVLKHAVPVEVTGIVCDMKKHPRNSSKNVVHRRFLPFGGAATNSTTINTISVTPETHELSEGVTPDADEIAVQDITVTLRQYGCLYTYTDVVADLGEDDIPKEQKIQTGERMGLLREMIRYGAMRGCTNRFFAGGSGRSSVAAGLTLTLLQRVQRGMQQNRSRLITRAISASPNYNTDAVEPGFVVLCHTDLEPDIRALPGFVPCTNYGSQVKKLHEMELGKVDRWRFVTSPELFKFADAGAAVGATGLASTSASNIDVYPVLVFAQDAFADVALRGAESFSVSHIPVGKKDSSDPLGQRGYVGAKFYSAAFVQNDGWMAVIEVGAVSLS